MSKYIFKYITKQSNIRGRNGHVVHNVYRCVQNAHEASICWRKKTEEGSTGAVLPKLSHSWPRWRGFYEEHLMVPGWLAKARSSALGTPCVIFYKHMETHAVGKLWRNLSDLPGKRQGNRCSEAERDTEAGRLPRTRGTGTGVWSQGCREGEGSACRADHSCGVFSALPLLRGADVSSQGRSRLRRQVCGPGGEQRAAQCRRDFLTSKVLVTPHPGQQPPLS